MVALATSGEKKFVRFKQQDVDAAYIGGKKIYGKNLWRFPINGGSGSNSLYGAWSIDNISSNAEHHAVTYSAVGSESTIALKFYNSLTTVDVDINKSYSFQITLKSTLPKVRLYVYIFGQGNPVRSYLLNDVKSDEWTTFTLTGLVNNTAYAAANTYRGTIFIGFTKNDYPGAADSSYFLNHRIEIKEMKLEEGELSPYSVHSSLL